MKWIGRWFWAPVRENENWAQTLVRVSGNLFRGALTLAVVVAGLIAAQIYLQGQTDRRAAQQSQMISVAANPVIDGEDGNGCNAEFPVAIIVRNESPQTLMRMEIEVSARVRGTSTNVLDYSDRRVQWDHIVPPQHVLAMCYRLGRDPIDPTAAYSAEPVSYSIELQPTEDWMLSETQAVLPRDRLTPPCRSGGEECQPWERDWGRHDPDEDAPSANATTTE